MMKYSLRNSLQIVLEFSDIPMIELTICEKNIKLQPVPPRMPLEAL